MFECVVVGYGACDGVIIGVDVVVGGIGVGVGVVCCYCDGIG